MSEPGPGLAEGRLSDATAFPVLTDRDLAVPEGLGKRMPVATGDYPYREGDTSYDFYAVLSAAVEVTARAGDADRVVARHGPGTSWAN